jgi:hypothetical protein
MSTLFYHGKTTDDRRFTIAGILNHDSTAFKLGIAICSEREIFNRKTGRIKAGSRVLGSAKRGVITSPPIMNKERYYKDFVDVCKEFDGIVHSRELKKIFNLDNSAY